MEKSWISSITNLDELSMDVIHGYETVFPIPFSLSCSWDMQAIKRSAQIAAQEASADGLNWTFSPMLDICVDPRWGRMAEGSGSSDSLPTLIAIATRSVQRKRSSLQPTARRPATCPRDIRPSEEQWQDTALAEKGTHSPCRPVGQQQAQHVGHMEPGCPLR